MLSHIKSNVDKLKEFRREVTREYKRLPIRHGNQLNKFYHETCVYTGYRCDYSFREVLYSIFHKTNETTNFWTHFLPSVFFMHRLYHLAQVYDFSSDPYYYPLFCYMVSIILYPLVSALAHGFSCMSPMIHHICFLIDYSSISFYAWGAGLLYFAYSMQGPFYGSWHSKIFLPVGSVLAVFATLCACFSRITRSRKLCKFLRLFAFTTPFIWDSIPLLMRVTNCDLQVDSCGVSNPHHITQFISITLACFFYSTHIPEVYFPGCFDIVGSSHNLLHVFGSLATFQQMEGALIDMAARRDFFYQNGFVVDPVWSWVATPMILLTNITTITIFAVFLSRDSQRLRPFLLNKPTSDSKKSK